MWKYYNQIFFLDDSILDFKSNLQLFNNGDSLQKRKDIYYLINLKKTLIVGSLNLLHTFFHPKSHFRFQQQVNIQLTILKHRLASSFLNITNERWVILKIIIKNIPSNSFPLIPVGKKAKIFTIVIRWFS